MAEKQNRRKAAIPAACTAVLVLAILAVCLWQICTPFPRLEVAGFRISREEYLRAMYQARNDVLSDHAAAGIPLTDWGEETALGDPCRLITERTLEILREYYAVSTLAVERGYLADAGFDAMVQDLEEVNRQRQEALDAGTVITGFANFSTDDFLAYRASNIRLQFCSDPENPEYEVTDRQIRQRYETDRDTLYYQPDSVDLAFLSVTAAPGEADGLEQAFRDLRQTALETGDLAAALADHPQLTACYQEISVRPENYAYYDRACSDVLACAAGLETGEISRVFRQGDRLCLVQCRQRTVHRYIPLEDAADLVVQSIRESRYDDLITARMNETEIRGDLQALYRFTAGQFT